MQNTALESEPRSSHSSRERRLLCRLLELGGGGADLGLTADVEGLRLGLHLRVERHVRVRDDGRHEDRETDPVESRLCVRAMMAMLLQSRAKVEARGAWGRG